MRRLGALTVSLPDELPAKVIGFKFSVTSGNAPFFVSDGILAPARIDKDTFGYRFNWPDLAPGSVGTHPIKFSLEISQVSNTGVVGPPIVIDVNHPGR